MDEMVPWSVGEMVSRESTRSKSVMISRDQPLCQWAQIDGYFRRCLCKTVWYFHKAGGKHVEECVESHM